ECEIAATMPPTTRENNAMSGPLSGPLFKSGRLLMVFDAVQPLTRRNLSGANRISANSLRHGLENSVFVRRVISRKRLEQIRYAKEIPVPILTAANSIRALTSSGPDAAFVPGLPSRGAGLGPRRALG